MTAAIFIRLAIASAGVRGVGFSLFLSTSRLAIASLVLVGVVVLLAGVAIAIFGGWEKPKT